MHFYIGVLQEHKEGDQYTNVLLSMCHDDNVYLLMFNCSLLYLSLPFGYTSLSAISPNTLYPPYKINQNPELPSFKDRIHIRNCLCRFSNSKREDKILQLFLGMFINLTTFQKQQTLCMVHSSLWLVHLDDISPAFIDVHLLISHK